MLLITIAISYLHVLVDFIVLVSHASRLTLCSVGSSKSGAFSILYFFRDKEINNNYI